VPAVNSAQKGGGLLRSATYSSLSRRSASMARCR
jgi:hypothetical protein